LLKVALNTKSIKSINQLLYIANTPRIKEIVKVDVDCGVEQ